MSHMRAVLYILGVAACAVGIGFFTWYQVEVLPSAEIDRLEAGASGTSSTFEFLVLASSPLAVALGVILLVLGAFAPRLRSR